MPTVLVRAGFSQVMDGASFVRLVREHDLGFVPLTVRSPAVRGTTAFGEAALARLAAAGRLSRAEVRGEDIGTHERRFRIVSFRGGIAQHVVWLPGDPDLTAPVIDALTQLPGFGFACVGDADDDFWQSETTIERYEQAGRPHDHLPKLPGGEWPWEDEHIDIRGNWGRGVEVGWVWLWATSTMWFGPSVFRWIDRQRLVESPVGEIAQGPNEVVRVKLFPHDWYRVNIDGMRERQRRFWEWMGFLHFEALSDEILDSLEGDGPSDRS